MNRVVTFVCLHGAGKSRVAAALFNVDPPPGWRADSAGLEPQGTASPHAARLLDGDPASAALDGSNPRGLGDRTGLVVTIDCAVSGASRWDLDEEWPAPAVITELRVLTQDLVAKLRQETDGG